MSTSSESEPPYNVFYGMPSRSAEKLSSTKQASRSSDKPHSREPEDFLSGILGSFAFCCAGLTNRAADPQKSSSSLPKGDNTILQRSFVEGDLDSSKSFDYSPEVPLNAAPVILKQDSKSFADHADEEELHDTNKEIEEVQKQLCSTLDIDCDAEWSIVLSLKQAVKLEIPKLDESNLRLIALEWCRKMELRERMNRTLLKVLFSQKEEIAPNNATISTCLKTFDSFSILEHVKEVESRLLEEGLTEFMELDGTREENMAYYIIVSRKRTVAIMYDRQGEVRSVNLFDTGCSLQRGPGFLAFSSTQKLHYFLTKLFLEESKIRKSEDKFHIWIIRSKYNINSKRDG